MFRSNVWQHFERIDDANAKCNSCLKTYRYCNNTTNLRKHLMSMHKEVFEAMLEREAGAGGSQITLPNKRARNYCF